MLFSEKQYQRANETIAKLNDAIKNNEKTIVKTNQAIQKAKDNYDYESVIKLEKNKRRLKQNRHEMKESRKTLRFMIANYTEIDKNTIDAPSNIPITKEYLKNNYKVSNTFNGVSLNSINDNLPHKLSQHTLNKLVVETFPDVKSRQCTNDIKYNMEMITNDIHGTM